MGYSDAKAEASSFLPGGWFLTGEIACIDADGFVTITDRKKDIIIRGGENISSREVEEVLLRVPGVRDAAAIAAPDARLGEKVCAVLVVAPGVAPTIADLDVAFREMGEDARAHRVPGRVSAYALGQGAEGGIAPDIRIRPTLTRRAGGLSAWRRTGA